MNCSTDYRRMNSEAESVLPLHSLDCDSLLLFQCRFVIKYGHSRGQLMVKMTDDREVSHISIVV